MYVCGCVCVCVYVLYRDTPMEWLITQIADSVCVCVCVCFVLAVVSLFLTLCLCLFYAGQRNSQRIAYVFRPAHTCDANRHTHAHTHTQYTDTHTHTHIHTERQINRQQTHASALA